MTTTRLMKMSSEAVSDCVLCVVNKLRLEKSISVFSS